MIHERGLRPLAGTNANAKIAASQSQRECLDVSLAADTDAGGFLDLHRSLLDELRKTGRLSVPACAARPLVEGYRKIAIADAPSRTLLVDAGGAPVAVLFVSSAVDAGYVARNLARAAEARQMLGADLGSVILDPLARGETGGLSYAAWPWHRPRTRIRGLAYLQTRLLLPRLTSWLGGATERSARDPQRQEIESAFVAPLERMARDGRFEPASRQFATEGLERLRSGAWRPRVVLEHKAILDNLLLPRDRAHRRQFPRGFILIDWAGANLRGYAFANLLRIGQRSRLPASHLRAELLRHCRILSCEARDIMPYLLAATGFVGANLGHFDEGFYVQMYREMLQFSHTVVRSLP